LLAGKKFVPPVADLSYLLAIRHTAIKRRPQTHALRAFPGEYKKLDSTGAFCPKYKKLNNGPFHGHCRRVKQAHIQNKYA